MFRNHAHPPAFLRTLMVEEERKITMAKNTPPKGDMAKRLMILHKIACCPEVWYENSEMNALARTVENELEKEISDLVREYEVAGFDEVSQEIENRLLKRLVEVYKAIISNVMGRMLDQGKLRLRRNMRLSLSPEKENHNG